MPYKGDSLASPSEDTWRAESDHGALQRASEIMVDRARMQGVLRHRAKMKKADNTMERMLTNACKRMK